MTGAPGKMGANNQLKLEMAKRLAAKINLSKNLGQEAQDITQQATKAIFQDGVSAPQVAVSITIGRRRQTELYQLLSLLCLADSLLI